MLKIERKDRMKKMLTEIRESLTALHLFENEIRSQSYFIYLICIVQVYQKRFFVES